MSVMPSIGIIPECILVMQMIFFVFFLLVVNQIAGLFHQQYPLK